MVGAVLIDVSVGRGERARARCSRSYRPVDIVPRAMTTAISTTNPISTNAGHHTN